MASIPTTSSGARWVAIRDEILVLVRSKPKPTHSRRPIRFGAWEYTDPHGVEEGHEARGLYLWALQSLEPGFVEDLLGEPFAAVEAIWRSRGWTDPPTERFPELDGDDRWDVISLLYGHSQDRSDGGVMAALDRWARRWGWPHEHRPSRTVGEWLIFSGLYTLVAWLLYPTVRQFSRISYFPGGPAGIDRPQTMQPYERTVAIEVSWYPVVEPIQDAEERLVAECRRAIRRDLQEVEAEAERRGMVRARVKRTGLDHFEWLVRYQLRGESYAEIARSVCKERQTVAEAIQKTAALIGLPLRLPDPTGPPRKLTPARIVRVEPRDR